MTAIRTPQQLHARPLGSLTPYARNSRTHSPEQIDALVASIREFGWTNPVLIDEHGGIIAGHGRVMAAERLGMTEVPCIVLAGLTDAQRRAYVIADNKLPEQAGWDDTLLAAELQALADQQFDLGTIGFTADELAALEIQLDPWREPAEPAAPPADEIPALPASATTRPGDLWILGEHRLLCGDSTDPAALARLMGEERAALLHADPPYGMGKQADGVANDNLYREQLDAFQMAWWRTARPHLQDNASAYIWGNAPELWRLWYCGGLADSERLTLRNEIVWAKVSPVGTLEAFGKTSAEMRCYPPATERCLFFMFGEQDANPDATDYWEGWEPIRLHLCAQRDRAGFTNSQMNRLCGKQNMTQAAFTRGGFRLILRDDYHKLREASGGRAFTRDYDDLRREYNALRQVWENTRAHFDNTHDHMTDVWQYPRVLGDDRHGHATPKPVAMMSRVMRSSLPEGGLCLEPFGGSGSTLMGAEATGRRCYTLELQPRYCDVIVARWEQHTGQQASLIPATEPAAA